MPRGRAMNQARRTYIPNEYLRLLGAQITLSLQEEHIRFDETKKRRTRYSIERVCKATGIPFSTMNAYLQGKRQPGILDLLEICRFTGMTFESIMKVIPSRKELDRMYDEEKLRVQEEARMRREGLLDDADEYDDGE